MNTVLMVALGVLLAALAAVAGLSVYFYNKAVARADKSFLQGDPGLRLNPNMKIDLQANRDWWAQQTCSIWSLTSDDGLQLKAYYLPAPSPTKATVILAHGYGGEAGMMCGLARLYHERLGMNVLLPDARGHGRSEGSYIGFGWKERLDYTGWIAQVIEQLGEEATIVLHGVSMGAATVMMTSGEMLPQQVTCIVEDCGYTSVEDELAYQLKRMYHLPSFPLIAATSLLTRLRAGYSFRKASALEQLHHNTRPMLFIHGEQDQFVPTSMVYRLYDACRAPKRLVVVPNAGHGESYLVDPDKYTQELIAFLSQYGNRDRPGRLERV
ncbi:alpha/beta hydrolase [Paenibacillus sp. SYP-B4298]|uniref:alpha/beta hydrolase n=1 Tax=Paenibacillus sp. SYP-B4298 TaxID=2996034 RepID=UPI0022DD071A|nr:alpha/beta hydrolase [Paenibacillus sp. SYP-B4298]